jgi:hypothetical protein
MLFLLCPDRAGLGGWPGRLAVRGPAPLLGHRVALRHGTLTGTVHGEGFDTSSPTSGYYSYGVNNHMYTYAHLSYVPSSCCSSYSLDNIARELYGSLLAERTVPGGHGQLTSGSADASHPAPGDWAHGPEARPRCTLPGDVFYSAFAHVSSRRC